ncbi:DNA repair protein RecO [Blastopirellula marina]|uniref:DNA repair protein RecO n=1 Tax=Blastopirellula marina DSM 3645 TaxID=314230 RepID=A3ZXS5_9BACT|nr:DNA repair protein RecO [Blastopirellula marina]EAQ78659.1 probable DNA repair protein recO [Blastopirellula marina DSM 3645]
MSSEKTTGIVIRIVEFSESSCITTLFTEDFGKISGIAKGCRRPKSAFESAIDLLSLCRIVFLHKTSDSLDILTEAKLLRKFRSAQRSLPHLYAGYYIAELLGEFTHESDPYAELFHIADQTLAELDGGGNVPKLVLHFELSLLRLLGQLPELSFCVDTGRPAPKTGRVPLGLLAGGVLSREARAGHRQVIDVTAETIEIFRRLAEPGESWRETEIPASRRGECRGVINRYITHQAGHRLKMHDKLGMLSE